MAQEALETPQGKNLREACVALKWSKRDGGYYDCIEAVTPVGTIRIEWKGWKDDDSPDLSLIHI